KLRDQDPGYVPALNEEGEHLLATFTPDSYVLARFEERLEAMDAKIRPYVLKMYANPVISRYVKAAGDPFAVAAEEETTPAA
ncbi:MAG TPA: hypothetical protein VKZ92_09195, partial [Pseudohongiella sp.]|nr:hypothetical protein [Pseudohongiella sp.]